jgi:serine/threonine-protein kinase
MTTGLPFQGKGIAVALFSSSTPTVSNKYRIEAECARGGMSVVYKGVRKSDDAPMAIKIITPEFAQLAEQLNEVFKKGSEGEIAISLRHPNVVRTYEYGSKGREYYIVMEYIDGPNLKQLIDMQSERWKRDRLAIALDVGRGLSYIHKNRLVHRDFCPKNILLTKDGTPKIIDFGLAIPAHLKQKWRWDRSGTAAYMAPEQVRGQKVNPRTDVYAYGVSAFEILTGHRPFPETRERNRKMAAHLNLQPTSARRYDKNIPVALEHVLMKAMAKQKDARYASVADMLKDMAAVVSAYYGAEYRMPEAQRD